MNIKRDKLTKSNRIDDKLDQIDCEISEMEDRIKQLDYEDREDILDRADDLKKPIFVLQDDMSDDQYERSEELLSRIHRLEDIDYDGPRKPYDPWDAYYERGLKPSDFY